MGITLTISLLLFATGGGVAQKLRNQEPIPDEIVIGRNSFIDSGPPFDYYDLTILHSEGVKTDVERISLTPPADTCYPRAEIRVAHVKLDETLSEILERTNPCTIPEKKLNAELKRRIKGSVFSGMNVSIQVKCAAGMRIIRADILDRDIFDDHLNTPQYTAWSRMLFEKLDKATGDHPWDKPIFPVSESLPLAIPAEQSRAMQAIASGEFDQIFSDAPDRPSVLYHMAQNVPRQPSIELTRTSPVHPATYVDPIYPPIAKAARVHGTVEFHLTVGADGMATGVVIDGGPKMLWQAVTDAIAKWNFLTDDSGKVIQGSIRFELNCAEEHK
jgi:hypothetical protein